MGHSNPQGLTIDSLGRIWETEHGPQGGDELNMLVKGSDYGYPSHTYGTEYGSVTWPPTDSSSGQMNSIRPVFAWVPSIGISEIVAVDDSAFERWRGDVSITSLRGKSLWRTRLEGQRVVYPNQYLLGSGYETSRRGLENSSFGP